MAVNSYKLVILMGFDVLNKHKHLRIKVLSIRGKFRALNALEKGFTAQGSSLAVNSNYLGFLDDF